MEEVIIATITDEGPELSLDSDETELQDVVYALAAAPDFEQSGICFAAQVTGLFRSPDKGHTWQDAYASLKLDSPLPTSAVALSPQFETDRTVFAGMAGAVLRSTDGGQTWMVATLPSPPPIVSMLTVSPNYAHDGMVFAGTLEDGVFTPITGGNAGRLEFWPAGPAHPGPGYLA
ncbi:MAG: hypothetical protein HC875_20080 [Anaerolineales bacterium]|nr:hypothetical protein [Anaerolineales bacterium]